ncbi:hypothetical protein AwDysgo_19440 [Bacteroidales bacterium]|nr:hypothetical protein AwDysgo_19440 [Bacteroidales bacterium]
MTINFKINLWQLLLAASVIFLTVQVEAQTTKPLVASVINHNPSAKAIHISDAQQNLSLIIDYAQGCKISQLSVKGKNTLAPSGVYTAIKTDTETFTSINKSDVKVLTTDNGVKITNVKYGNQQLNVQESWSFEAEEDKIIWTILREYNNKAILDDIAFPTWNFADLSLWKGGIFDNGGMVWCKYLANTNDTYGVHTAGVTFWNPDTGNALRIKPRVQKGRHLAAKYSHNEDDEFQFTQYVTDTELMQRYNLSRFVAGKADVFAPFYVKKGSSSITLEISYVDYNKEYSRGTLPAINATAVRELLNTTGRYGVVDNNIIGANGWITNWKCLHEPFFAQIGMALNDENYTQNFSATLDQERDQAMLADGRVLSRWHDIQGDEIEGTYNTKTGYYEAMWGYTIDSQTGYIINTTEQFHLNGNLKWLKGHKLSCERALDWLIRRDTNNNGIFEMKNDNIAQQKASDWLDIVWAGFENAFVNAQMYEALNLWAECEKILGDSQKAQYYAKVALRLKESFNKPIDQGGFWHPEKKQYIYWRDKDQSIHGDNLVTPVNFAAIAFGICDDKNRIAQILDQIESRTSDEQLFHWPLCFDSFKKEEVHANNWPFPQYENGDIFPTWGYMGIRAYANYDKEIALKYIRNILDQYQKDGLSSQRYSRSTQLGLGSDILAGICTSITALYRDIYGIRPQWNRMGLEPNMSSALNGTDFNYTLRNKIYKIQVSYKQYQMSSSDFAIKSNMAFGVSSDKGKLIFYPHNREDMKLSIACASSKPIDMQINDWKDTAYSWAIGSSDKYKFSLDGLVPSMKYELLINNKASVIAANKNGSISFSYTSNSPSTFSIRQI